MSYENWLQPIVEMIQEGEFREAYALAEYFPHTHSRRIVQLVALLGQNNIKEANSLFSQFTCEIYNLVEDVTTILSQGNFNLLEVGLEAIGKEHCDLGIFCIEFKLRTHPKAISLVADINNLVKQLITSYLKSKGLPFLNKAFSLLNLINYTKRDNIQRFTNALVELDYPLYILECYGELFVNLELDSTSYLELVKALIKSKTRNYNLINLLLKKSLQYEPKKRVEVLKLYIQLSKIADKTNDLELSKRFLIVATNISTGLREFSKILNSEISEDIKLANFSNYYNK